MRRSGWCVAGVVVAVLAPISPVRPAVADVLDGSASGSCNATTVGVVVAPVIGVSTIMHCGFSGASPGHITVTGTAQGVPGHASVRMSVWDFTSAPPALIVECAASAASTRSATDWTAASCGAGADWLGRTDDLVCLAEGEIIVRGACSLSPI